MGIRYAATRRKGTLAPFHHTHDDPEALVAHKNVVWLYHGHSLSKHFEAIGEDISEHIQFQFNFDTRVVYAAWLNDKRLHAVPSDRRVEILEQNIRIPRSEAHLSHENEGETLLGNMPWCGIS